MTTVKVSILIPVYNRERYIAECIQSALDQSYTQHEIVVVDNASDDGTWEICQQFADRDPRVRVFRNDENIGPVRNWLACVACAKGDYVKILWSDDLIAPSFLEETVPYLADPDTGFVYSTAKIFAVGDKETGAIAYSGIDTGTYESVRYIEGALLGGEEFPVSPGCALFRLSDVKKNLLLHVPNSVGSDFSMHAIGNDLLLFLLTAQEYKNIAIVNEPLAYFRAHEGSITTSSPAGRIPLHYDLVKGFFVEKYIKNNKWIKKMNAILFLHLISFDSWKFGIRSVNSFYPSNKTINFCKLCVGIRYPRQLLRWVIRHE